MQRISPRIVRTVTSLVPGERNAQEKNVFIFFLPRRRIKSQPIGNRVRAVPMASISHAWVTAL